MSALLYRQLADKLKRAIDHGSLKSGDRLPSVRELSEREQVSLATAVTTYRHLENQGLVEARPKSGFFVREQAHRLAEPEMQRRPARAKSVTVVDTIMQVISESRQPGLVPLGAACASPLLYPTAKLRRLIAAQDRDNLDAIGRYGMSMGHTGLREQIVKRFARLDTLLLPENIIVTIGAMEAINLCVRAVAKPGDIIAIESPTYFGILQIIESLGMKALEIPTDPRTGISLEALDLATQKAGAVKAVIVMPTVQNPLGSTMPEENKQRLVELMETRGIPVIEDDIYGDLSFARQRPRPLKVWDKTGNVMLCSSFTKNIAPGFRVGWVAAGRWQEAITHLKFTNTVSTPMVFQSAIAKFMEEGGYDHHMRHLREAFQTQIRHVRETVERHFPEGTRLTRPEGGFLLWVELPKGIDSIELFQRAIAEKIYIAPGKIFTSGDRFDNYIRLNCGYPWSGELEKGLIRLGKLCEVMLKE